jgi:type II secretory pathway predicted ATPase ExeA
MAYDPTTPRLADAFALTADPSAYVPRLALESALAELAEGISKKPACVALTGEAGLGKTLLLHVLRQRLEGSYEALYVPFPHLAAPELWRWVAVALGLGHGEDDRGAVLGRAVRLAAEGLGLVLLVDDAGALPSAARSELIAACNTKGFSLVMAFDSEDQAQLATLPAHVRRIDLGPPMTPAETRAYVQARLRRVDPEGAFVAHLDLDRLAALHDASGGVPAHLHALLDAWLRNPSAEPMAPVAAAAQLPGVPLPAWLLGARALVGPRMRLALLALFVAVTAGFWLFALQRGPGVPSVGVPVEHFEPPGEEPVNAAPPPPAPAAPQQPSPEAPGSAEEGAATQVAG